MFIAFEVSSSSAFSNEKTDGAQPVPDGRQKCDQPSDVAGVVLNEINGLQNAGNEDDGNSKYLPFLCDALEEETTRSQLKLRRQHLADGPFSAFDSLYCNMRNEDVKLNNIALGNSGIFWREKLFSLTDKMDTEWNDFC